MIKKREGGRRKVGKVSYRFNLHLLFTRKMRVETSNKFHFTLLE
jgi:hypothetical protein